MGARMPADSDLDGIIDILDSFPEDFNNDGIPDDESIITLGGQEFLEALNTEVDRMSDMIDEEGLEVGKIYPTISQDFIRDIEKILGAPLSITERNARNINCMIHAIFKLIEKRPELEDKLKFKSL